MSNNNEETNYNGWTNYETWYINLWLTNDQSSYNYWSSVTNECTSIHELSEQIKDDIDKNNPLSSESSLYSDLLSSAISSCNFYEIAQSFWQDFRPSVIEKAKEDAALMIEAFNASKDDPDCINNNTNYDEPYISVYYGSILDLTPSGKYYTPFANSNITEDEADADETYWSELESVLSSHNLWYESGEGDPLDIYICGHIEETEDNDSSENKVTNVQE